MASPWKSVFKELPPNNTIVWIRVTSVYGELALAKYKAAKMQFTTTITSIVIPAQQVSRWKYQ